MMVTTLKRFVTRSKFAAMTAVVAFGIVVTGAAVMTSQTQSVSASTCDKVNIIYCGLTGSSASGYIDSFQKYYDSNKSGHNASPTVNKDYTDVQKVFNYFGASSSLVNGMDTGNTKVGYLYRDGRVVVDGKTVGTGGTVAARFSVPGAVNIEGTNVYVRKTTSSFAQDKAKVIVYFKDGVMKFGVMINCGNAIDAKPVEQPKPPTPETPTQTLVCTSLKATPSTTVKNQVAFTANATPTNGATISNYEFVFGDNTNVNVQTGAQSAEVNHIYAKPGTYTATVNVTGKINGSERTVPNTGCAVSVTIEAPAQALTCVSLKPAPTANKNEFKFVATAKPINGATISSYTFTFGDTKSTTVTSSEITAETVHAYTSAGNYPASVIVNGTANGKPVTATDPACAAQISIEVPPAPECKPGIPEGDARCTPAPCEYNPELPADSPECKAPEVMPATGPAGIAALFSATTAFGAMSHRIFLKRRLR